MLQPDTIAYIQPPETLKIGNLFFSVRFYDGSIERGSRMFGWCNTDDQAIYLSNRTAPAKQAETFLHEIVHALYWFYALPEKAEEEQVCKTIPSGINMIFFDNPDWLSWYLRSINNTSTTTKQ
jgi:hypothetical protein